MTTTIPTLNLRPIIDVSKSLVVSQTVKHEKTSDKYAFIPSSKAVGILADHGWHPTVLLQANSQKNHGFQKHLIRFRNNDLATNSYYPEIVMTNSHMGTAAFKMMLGVYRLICANGLILGQTYNTMTVRHMNFKDEEFSNAVKQLAYNAPTTVEVASNWQKTQLNEIEAVEFANNCIEMVKNGDTWEMSPHSVLKPRRFADAKSTDLWTTFNRVQENFMKGGSIKVNELGRRARSRAIKSLDENVRINRGLWNIAERVYDRKQLSF